MVISDVVGDRLGDIASGPTAPDESTFLDAQNVLKKYQIWENAPATVRKVLSQGQQGIISETPKPNEAIFKKVHNVIIGNNQTVCTAALKYFEAQGIETHLLTYALEGEAQQVGAVLSSKNRKAAIASASARKPICFIAGEKPQLL